MPDRYTELVKQAYDAQQAREGEAYAKLTAELTRLDADLEALKAKREAAVADLEAMDDAVEAAKDALDAYFAGRDEGDEALFEAEQPAEDHGYVVNATSWDRYEQPEAEDEFSTPRANGGLT